MKYFIIITLLVAVNVACNNEQQKVNTVDTMLQSEADKPTVTNETLIAAYRNIDALEQLFGNENYLLVNGNDSNYLYFTRLGKNSFFTHSYKLKNGDSTQLQIDTIQVNKQGKVQWNWQDKKLTLQDCNNIKALWQNDTAAGGDKVDFLKNTANQLSISFNNKQLPLTKTLPISLFLVRSKYDYQHHTHYAFDTTNFSKKH
ncbi:MAG: hypothetical protein ACOVO1_09350 [Chitinophagaceae bacterium]